MFPIGLRLAIRVMQGGEAWQQISSIRRMDRAWRRCVIDAFVRVTLVGIELLAIEARVVIASVDTWLKYAEAVGLTTTFDQVAAIP